MVTSTKRYLGSKKFSWKCFKNSSLVTTSILQFVSIMRTRPSPKSVKASFNAFWTKIRSQSPSTKSCTSCSTIWWSNSSKNTSKSSFWDSISNLCSQSSRNCFYQGCALTCSKLSLPLFWRSMLWMNLSSTTWRSQARSSPNWPRTCRLFITNTKRYSESSYVLWLTLCSSRTTKAFGYSRSHSTRLS